MILSSNGRRDEVRITFGIIVLNGEPFTRYCLRALYPYAHEIIVVEGACEAAQSVATEDGHSVDGTLDVLRRFAEEEDPEGKLRIVTAEDEGYPDGFWPGEKDEKSRAYASRATGNYLWQVDIDEFYMPGDVEKVIDLLRGDPAISAVSFKQIQFWGGLSYRLDGWYLRRGAEEFHRLFRWDAGSRYVTHRPPTVVDALGVDLREKHWIDGSRTAAMGIALYHYSYVFPKQVEDKCAYYANVTWADHSGMDAWARDTYSDLRHPYRIHGNQSLPAWLERFGGAHPPQIQALWAAVEQGEQDVEVRATDDIERMLRSRSYRMGRHLLRLLAPLDRRLKFSRRWIRLARDPAPALRRRIANKKGEGV